MFKKECCECGREMILEEKFGWTEESAKYSEVICDDCDELLRDIDDEIDNLDEDDLGEYLYSLRYKELKQRRDVILNRIRRMPIK